MQWKIKRVDYAKILYLYFYGGMYSDTDMFPVSRHEFREAIDLIMGATDQGLAFEWIWARKPKPPFLDYLVKSIDGKGHVLHSTGPYKIQKSFTSYFGKTCDGNHCDSDMVTFLKLS